MARMLNAQYNDCLQINHLGLSSKYNNNYNFRNS